MSKLFHFWSEVEPDSNFSLLLEDLDGDLLTTATATLLINGEEAETWNYKTMSPTPKILNLEKDHSYTIKLILGFLGSEEKKIRVTAKVKGVPGNDYDQVFSSKEGNPKEISFNLSVSSS